jgi:hypothetical protein
MGSLTPEMSADLEGEILKGIAKKEEIDRSEYLEGIKKNLESKKEQLGPAARELVDKLQKMEPVLGDTSLYGDIAGELGKLRGGEDIARLFENIILKMADMSREKAAMDLSSRVSVAEQNPDTEDVDEAKAESENTISRLSGTISPHTEQSPAKNKLDSTDLNGDSTPIDIVQTASNIESESDREANDLDWNRYGERLSERYKKK